MPTHFPPSAWSLHADEWQRMTAEHDGGSLAEHTIELFPDPPVDLPRRVWRAEDRINLALYLLADDPGNVAGVRRQLVAARAILGGEEPDALGRAA